MSKIKKGAKEEALERMKGKKEKKSSIKGNIYTKADDEFKAGYNKRKGHEDKEEELVKKSAPKGR